MPIGPMATKICSQTQKTSEFWVWSSYFFDIEKILVKIHIFSPDFEEYWVWTKLDSNFPPEIRA